MLKIVANVVGVIAVAIFVFSYQQRTRRGIVLCNVISRALYVVQYMLLFAFEGAVLDVVGILASVLAQRKETPVIKKHMKIIATAVNLLIVAVGLLMYKNPFSLLPMLGVLFHTGAFWFSNEKTIRIISLIGSPCWLVYNLYSFAYGSALGDALTIASIVLAMVRYDFKRKDG